MMSSTNDHFLVLDIRNKGFLVVDLHNQDSLTNVLDTFDDFVPI